MLPTLAYLTFVIICITQSIYPILMVLAMIVRQSRLLQPLFNPVDKTSKKHGGQLVAQVLKAHGVDHVFTLAGGHISPILTAAEKVNIRVIDVRHEATAVFAADAMARLTGRPGVAVVTAGPGLTNTVTAVKNAQMAESPLIVMSGAAATLLKGRGSLQDIEQLSLLKTTTKKQFTIEAVRDIVPTLREAFRISACGVPGPVFVEFPVDTLYPYEITAAQFSKTSGSSSSSVHKPSLLQRIVRTYAQYSLDQIFAGAWQERDCTPHPISISEAKERDIRRTVQLIKEAKRPLIIMGSQSTLRPYGPQQVADGVRQLGIPVYLNGSARGLLGAKAADSIQFRHARSEAVREADLVLLLGVTCDFRLSYGRIFNSSSKVVSVNRSRSLAQLNSPVFWKPTLAIEADVGKFVVDLVGALGGLKTSASSVAAEPDHNDNVQQDVTDDQTPIKLVKSVDPSWLEILRARDQKRDHAITLISQQPTVGNQSACSLGESNADNDDEIDNNNNKPPPTEAAAANSNRKPLDDNSTFINPLKVIMSLDRAYAGARPILVADGGDFVASASYILRPDGPGRWLDPGPFGTLGCGAGFALAAKLLHPELPVVCVMGDGAFGYAVAEIDTFVRHKCHVMFVIGNDACWTQIAREQVPMLGSSISCNLAYTDYHKVGSAFGALGVRLTNHCDDLDGALLEARQTMEKKNKPFVVNAIIGKTKFRDGSISV